MAKVLSIASSRTWFSDSDPGLNESMVEVGNGWINTSTGKSFKCCDSTANAQVWHCMPSCTEVTTFTPVLQGTSTPGAGTYSSQVGYWSKIDDRVFVEIFLDWSAHTGTGNMRITGLPVSVNAFISPAVPIQLQNVALPASSLMVWGNLSGTQMDLVTSLDNAAVAAIPMDGSGILKASFSYYA